MKLIKKTKKMNYQKMKKLIIIVEKRDLLHKMKINNEIIK